MKTPAINLSKAVFGVAFIAALWTAASCSSGNSTAQQDGTSPNATGDVESPAVDIHTAVITENVAALQQHIAAGTNLNEKDPFGGSSPLITAAIFGKPAMAELLITAGADLNFQNNEGSTPLISAAFFGRAEIVRMLLDSGADKTIKNKYGATAYDSVAAPFGEVKNTYDIMGKMLAPMGLKLDYAHLEKVRPEIATMLK
ncbi:ankyrin repeat domain-containing protein [Parapedobacter koreensis]|uniref:Ankyrin repeat-containing protein n=1 Tax=Parapedobacter koreensis TaxID=332977 RepID=A0A1H7R264_9SPHI|nr:ankyrin repeat domain-containing protein [Parapedobacter koreensis]SEL54025.1 Ankyrin repeat-containing protein [Parapedobacter koreensis]